MRGSFVGPPSDEGGSHLGRFGNLRIFQATGIQLDVPISMQPPVPVGLIMDTTPAAPIDLDPVHQDAAAARTPLNIG